jgi:hypothetical protein
MDVQLVENTISERMLEPLVLVLRQHYGPSRAVAAVVPLAGHAAFPALCGPYCLAALAFVDVLGARRPRRKPATRATFRGNAPGTRALDGVRRFGPLARRNSGFFKQYELIYVLADERDLIRVRTNFRNEPPEQVYLYRVRGRGENARFLFLEYMRKINALKDKPEFYNTLTTNCTGNIWLHTRVNPGHLPFSWKILLSGYVPEYLYEAGRLDMSLSFYELKRRSLVNARAQEADAAEDFSQRIRAGLPLPVP